MMLVIAQWILLVLHSGHSSLPFILKIVSRTYAVNRMARTPPCKRFSKAMPSPCIFVQGLNAYIWRPRIPLMNPIPNMTSALNLNKN